MVTLGSPSYLDGHGATVHLSEVRLATELVVPARNRHSEVSVHEGSFMNGDLAVRLSNEQRTSRYNLRIGPTLSTGIIYIQVPDWDR